MGLPRLKLEEIFRRIMLELNEKKVLRATDIAALLKCSMPSAYNYARQFAATYSNNVVYAGGVLALKESFTKEQLSPEEQIKILELHQKMLKEKLQKNHLTHLEKMLLERRLDDALKELEKLKKTIQEEL